MFDNWPTYHFLLFIFFWPNLCIFHWSIFSGVLSGNITVLLAFRHLRDTYVGTPSKQFEHPSLKPLYVTRCEKKTELKWNDHRLSKKLDKFKFCLCLVTNDVLLFLKLALKAYYWSICCNLSCSKYWNTLAVSTHYRF